MRLSNFHINLGVMLLLFLLPAAGWGATYYTNPKGAAANKESATGPCTTAANCMSPSTYQSELSSMSDGDIIVHCHVESGIPMNIPTMGFINTTQTLSFSAPDGVFIDADGKYFIDADGKYLIVQ